MHDMVAKPVFETGFETGFQRKLETGFLFLKTGLSPIFFSVLITGYD
jgi:hypothetical protein